MTRKRVSSNRRQRERLKQEIDRAMRSPEAMPADVMHAGRESNSDENAAEGRERRRQ